MATHENFQRSQKKTLSTDRTFGLVFATFFLVVALVSYVRHGTFLWWLCGLAVLFIVIAVTVPQVLRPFNIAWFWVGEVLHKIISPIILGVLFYLVFTPFGLVLKLLRKDLLRLKWDAQAETYWISREKDTHPGERLKTPY